MAGLTLSGSNIGNPLTSFLLQDSLIPGDEPSYQMCKTIYLHHPLGPKMAESPIKMAQCQQREISIPKSPETMVRDAYLAEWKKLACDKHIFNTMRLSRIYGVSSVALLVDGTPPNRPVNFPELWNKKVSINVFDPLNTSGSLVLNQDPNAMDFQKHRGIAVQGQSYHRSRCVVVLNEEPIYIGYTSSAFGYVGRSVYQRGLFPLKSFIQSMRTDDMVSRKAGLLVAKMQQAGSIVDNIMMVMAGIKRQFLKEGVTDNILTIGADEAIETLNMQNTDVAMTVARKNILENIAVSADMPAILLNSETFAEGFGEGSEDAKNVARFVDRVRVEMQPLYDFFDMIVQYRAWNPEFYKVVQAAFPEPYAKMGFKQAFYEWQESFAAEWPSLLTEPESEKIKVEETKFKTIIDTAETLLPVLDPINKATLIGWMQSNLNANKVLFTDPLELNLKALAEYEPPQMALAEEGGASKPPSTSKEGL